MRVELSDKAEDLDYFLSFLYNPKFVNFSMSFFNRKNVANSSMKQRSARI